MEGNSEAQFTPCGGIHQGGHNAEIKADIEEDGADRAVMVLGGDFREHFFLGGGQTVERGNLGRPAGRDGPSGGARLARSRPPTATDSLRDPILWQGEGEKGGDAPAEPGLERGGAEQAADDEDGDQGGIGGAEGAREEGIAGKIIGVVFLAQCLDEVPAVGDEGVEEAEDPTSAGGVEARGHDPIGIGV